MKKNTASEYLGEFEHLVLLAIIRLGDDAYGVTIRRTIAERAERSVSFGAVYSTLRRLETKRNVVPGPSRKQESAVGRPRQMFSVTSAGLDVIHAAQRRIERMSKGISVTG